MMMAASTLMILPVVALFFLMTLYRTISGLWSNADGLQVWDRIVASPWYWLEMVALAVAFYLMVGAATRTASKAMPGERCNWETTTLSAPLITNVPRGVM